MAARHQDSLGQSDELIKKVVEGEVTAIKHALGALEASVTQLHFEAGLSAAAAAPVRAPPGPCAPCGQNAGPFHAGAGVSAGMASWSMPCGGHGAPHDHHHTDHPTGPPGIQQKMIFPNGLCHCDHVVAQGNALTVPSR